MRWCSEGMTLSLAPPPPPPVGLFGNNKSGVFQFQKPFLKFKFNNSSLLVHRNPPLAAQLQASSSRDFVVVNFYHFVFIKNPQQLVAKHLSFLESEGLDINGRIYLNEQGINAQYSGPSKDAITYVNWIKEDTRFSDILLQITPSQTGHTFPSLKLRYKPSLVQFKGGISDLPLLDPSMRALPLSPSEWRDRLQAINKNDPHSKDYSNRNNIILDVRNGYEWDIGHFRGAQRPNVDCFRSTSFGLSQEEITASDPLSNVDKENANILMYCTGGIRCDVYSTILRQHGFQNLYTLKGGVSHYIKNEGAAEWIGNLFVFDSRLSLPPPVTIPEGRRTPVSRDDKFAKCYICNVEVSELRHRNCANLDCNLLFLCCRNCVEDLKGCCCLTCTTAPRLRPALIGEQRYKKWHIYRDMDLQVKCMGKDDTVADKTTDITANQTRAVEAESSQIRVVRVVPTNSYQKRLTEQRQFRAPRSTRRRAVRSVEQSRDDDEVVHAQDVLVQDVHDPVVEIDVTHVAAEVVDEVVVDVVQSNIFVADDVVQSYVIVADEMTVTDLFSSATTTQRLRLRQRSRLCTLIECSREDLLIGRCLQKMSHIKGDLARFKVEELFQDSDV